MPDIIWPKEGNKFTEEEEQEITGTQEPETEPENPEGGNGGQDDGAGGEGPSAPAPPQEPEPEASTNEEPEKPSKEEPEVPQEPETPEEPEPPAHNYDELFQEISSETGLNIANQDDLKATLKELSEAKNNPYGEISDVLKKAIDYEKNGGDTREYFRINQIDTDSLSDKEALREKWMLENKEYASKNPSGANKIFEREYNQKFGVIDREGKQMDDEEDAPSQEEIDFAKAKREQEALAARETIKKQQGAFEVPKKEEQKEEPNNEEFLKQHQQKAQETIDNFGGIALPIDDEGGKFQFGLDSQTFEKAKNAVQNPKTFLEDIGFGEQDIDTDQLMAVAQLVYGYENLGKQLSKHVLENNTKKTLDHELENPRPNDAPTGGKVPYKSPKEQMAEQQEERRQRANM